MNTPKKTDLARLWLLFEDQLAEDEASRIGELSEPQLLAELESEGFDTSRIPTADTLMAGAVARATALDARAPSGRTAKVVPIDAGRARVRSKAQAEQDPVPERRSSRLPLFIAAAVAAIIVLFIWVKRHDIEARLWGPEIAPDNDNTPYVEPPAKVARKLRDEAETACQLRDWADCRAKLDRAKRLDPAGESEEQVQGMRRTIDTEENRQPLDPNERLRQEQKQ
jgi:hypothetical protein